VHVKVNKNSKNNTEVGMSAEQLNYYNTLVNEYSSCSIMNQENVQLLEFYRDAFNYITKKFSMNIKELVPELAKENIVFPKVSHTEQRLGSEHLQLPKENSDRPKEKNK